MSRGHRHTWTVHRTENGRVLFCHSCGKTKGKIIHNHNRPDTRLRRELDRAMARPRNRSREAERRKKRGEP